MTVLVSSWDYHSYFPLLNTSHYLQPTISEIGWTQKPIATWAGHLLRNVRTPCPNSVCGLSVYQRPEHVPAVDKSLSSTSCLATWGQLLTRSIQFEWSLLECQYGKPQAPSWRFEGFTPREDFLPSKGVLLLLFRLCGVIGCRWLLSVTTRSFQVGTLFSSCSCNPRRGLCYFKCNPQVANTPNDCAISVGGSNIDELGQYQIQTQHNNIGNSRYMIVRYALFLGPYSFQKILKCPPSQLTNTRFRRRLSNVSWYKY